MNPWVLIVANYGLPFALELARIIESKGDPTAADFEALIAKYGTETLPELLAKYKATHPGT